MCDLHDLGFTGLPWTYDNQQFGRRYIRVRLDRVVASPSWSNLFEGARVVHLVSPCSDHCPILLKVIPDNAVDRKTRIARYEIMWEREESMGEVILDAWENGPPRSDLGSVACALRNIMSFLQEWSREKLGSVRKQLEVLRAQLADLQGRSDDESWQQVKDAAEAMNEMLYREEMMRLQRSRITWLKEGDKNTKYFHQKAVWRSRKNRIRRLKADNGQWCDDPVQMAAMATDFFKALYTRDANVTPEHLVLLMKLRRFL
jgi:hypothetical protein